MVCPMLDYFELSQKIILIFSLYRSLLIVRSQYGQLDDGARFHVFSHLIIETLMYGKSMFVTNISGRDDYVEINNSKESVSILRFIQKDRVLAAVSSFFLVLGRCIFH